MTRIQVLALVALVLSAVVFVRRRYSKGLSDVPGPFLASFSILWQVWHVIKGDIEWESIRLHKEHGAYCLVACLLARILSLTYWQYLRLCRDRPLCSDQSQGSQCQSSRWDSGDPAGAAP